jgi:hypothetical protein
MNGCVLFFDQLVQLLKSPYSPQSPQYFPLFPTSAGPFIVKALVGGRPRIEQHGMHAFTSDMWHKSNILFSISFGLLIYPSQSKCSVLWRIIIVLINWLHKQILLHIYEEKLSN